MNYKQMAENNTILRMVVGSQAYGLSDGPSDIDEKGVCIEPFEVFAGFNGFEQFEFRTATERTGDRHAKSQVGDLDLTIYSLKKYLSLALKGNPNILEMLFIENPTVGKFHGAELQNLYPYIVSKSSASAYLGYMKQQRAKMAPERGRPELVEKYGYDVKFAMHLIRLGYQCCDLMQYGKLELPIVGKRQEKLMKIRRGEFPLEYIMGYSEGQEMVIKDTREESKLRDTPDIAYVENWMLTTYKDWWAKPAPDWRFDYK